MENRVAVQPWGLRQPCPSQLSSLRLARVSSYCTDHRETRARDRYWALTSPEGPHGAHAQECALWAGGLQSVTCVRASECQPRPQCLRLRALDHSLSRPIKIRRPNSVKPGVPLFCLQPHETCILTTQAHWLITNVCQLRTHPSAVRPSSCTSPIALVTQQRVARLRLLSLGCSFPSGILAFPILPAMWSLPRRLTAESPSTPPVPSASTSVPVVVD